MRVSELIEKLKALPPEAIVIIPNGDYANYLEANAVGRCEVKRSIHDADILEYADGDANAMIAYCVNYSE